MSEQEKPCEWTALPFTEADKQWLEWQAYVRGKILSIFAAPISLLRMEQDVNRTSLESTEKAFLGEKHED